MAFGGGKFRDGWLPSGLGSTIVQAAVAPGSGGLRGGTYGAQGLWSGGLALVPCGCKPQLPRQSIMRWAVPRAFGTGILTWQSALHNIDSHQDVSSLVGLSPADRIGSAGGKMTNTVQRILVIIGSGSCGMHAPASDMKKRIGTKRKQPLEQGHRIGCVVGTDQKTEKSKWED